MKYEMKQVNETGTLWNWSGSGDRRGVSSPPDECSGPRWALLSFFFFFLKLFPAETIVHPHLRTGRGGTFVSS